MVTESAAGNPCARCGWPGCTGEAGHCGREHNPNPPYLRVEPGIRFGAHHIRGVSADAVAAPITGGDGVTETAVGFGLTRAETLLCCWFMAVYGAALTQDPRWSTKWGPWLKDNFSAMAAGRWDDVPDPGPFPGAGRYFRTSNNTKVHRSTCRYAGYSGADPWPWADGSTPRQIAEAIAKDQRLTACKVCKPDTYIEP